MARETSTPSVAEPQTRGLLSLCAKGQRVNILGFVGLTISVTIIQLCPASKKQHRQKANVHPQKAIYLSSPSGPAPLRPAHLLCPGSVPRQLPGGEVPGKHM